MSPLPLPLPPAQPAYVFRGHTAQIHSVAIVRQNTHLITGDADGWVVCWKLASKRPVAVWRAHDASILGAAAWGRDNLVTSVFSSRRAALADPARMQPRA